MTYPTFSPIQRAMMHLAQGRFAQILKEQPVEAGQHKIGNRRLVLEFGPDSAVVRDVGKGDGLTDEPVQVKLTYNAVLLFIDRAAHQPPANEEEIEALWKLCILDDLRGIEASPPSEAVRALAQVQEGLLDKGETVETKTQARRFGEKRIKMAFSRVEREKKQKRRKASAA